MGMIVPYCKASNYSDSIRDCPAHPLGAHGRCLDFIEANTKVLDIGCGRGLLSRQLKLKGCYVVGMEISPELAKKVSDFCDQVIVTDVESYNFHQLELFDVVVCADILEHLKYPERLLSNLRYVLKPEGYVVASIPNVAYWKIRMKLMMGDFSPDLCILQPQHIKFFTLKTIKEMFEKTGYKIVKLTISYYGMLAFSQRRLYRLLRWLGNRRKTVFGQQFIFKAIKREKV